MEVVKTLLESDISRFHDDYENRVAQEEMLRGRTEALVAQMEKEEMELIQRLQNTQTVQRRAYEVRLYIKNHLGKKDIKNKFTELTI